MTDVGMTHGGNNVKTVTPDQISGLVLWLDASRRSSLTLDGSNRCGTWSDLSGQGNDVTQATDSNKPTLAAAAVNGLDALLFDDGASQFLRNDSWSSITAAPFTSLAVFKQDTTGINSCWVSMGDSGTNDNHWRLYANSSDALKVEALDGVTGSSTVVGGATTDAAVVTGVEASSTSRTIYKNGSPAAENTTAVSPSSVDRLAVGAMARLSNGFYFSGHICEVLLFDVVLSAANRSSIESYLANKWGVTLA